MSETTVHPAADQLVALLTGELADPGRDGQSELLLGHVERCELCLERCERIWAETSPLGAGPPAEMDLRVAERVERGLLARTYRVRLAEDVTDLASRGLLAVVLGLLTPVLALLSPPLQAPARRRS